MIVRRLEEILADFHAHDLRARAGGREFVYVNSGTLAGQAESLWTRRAKVTLQALKWAVVDRVASESGSRLEVRITGTARDGGPACASVPLLDGGWAVKRVGEARATRR